MFFILWIFWKIIASFLVLLLAAFLIGVIRLFVFGPRVPFADPIKDISALKKGDILLTGKKSVTHSWYIQVSNVLTRKLKHRFWTHAALYQGNGKVWEAQPQGVIEKEVADYLKNHFLVCAFRHRYLSDEKILDQAIAFCAGKKGYRYGLIGAIFFAFSSFMPISFNWIFDNPWFDRWFHLDNAYFCSELIVDAFEEIGYPISPYDGWRVKPTDFISNPLLTPVVT